MNTFVKIGDGIHRAAVNIPEKWRRPSVFGIWGALGCVVLAAVGEIVLAFGMPATLSTRPEVDVVFVLDVTGSMSGEIEGIKEGIASFSTELTGRGFDARYGLVAFRDEFLDEPEPPVVVDFKGSPFTADPVVFSGQVSSLKAGGGGDDHPETSLQALTIGADLPYRASATRVLVLVTDAAPKIHSGLFVRPSILTVESTASAIKQRGIEQLHLVSLDTTVLRLIGPLGSPVEFKIDNPKVAYSGFRPTIAGEFFEMSKNSSTAERRAVFQRILPSLSAKIADGIGALQGRGMYDFDQRGRVIVVTAAWTGLLAVGICLALLFAQSTLLRRSTPAPRDALKAASGSFAAGCGSGVAGCVLFASARGAVWDHASWAFIGALVGFAASRFIRKPPAATGVQGDLIPKRANAKLLAPLIGAVFGVVAVSANLTSAIADTPARLVGWAVLGACIGAGMSFFVPNLAPKRGALGGLAGGAIGAVGFTVIGMIVGDWGGRIVGTAVLGFAIGFMVAYIEAIYREAWLEVVYGPGESATIGLGSTPVTVGSSANCTVYARGAAEIAFRYTFENGVVACEDIACKRTRNAVPGERNKVGTVEIVVRSASPDSRAPRAAGAVPR